MSTRCDSAAVAGTLYALFRRVGLEYGPAYRTLEMVLAAAMVRAGEAGARLRRRAEWQGARVHPADLDGALQLSVVLAGSGEASGETRLPFSVERASLWGAKAAVLVPVRATPHTPSRAPARAPPVVHQCPSLMPE